MIYGAPPSDMKPAQTDSSYQSSVYLYHSSTERFLDMVAEEEMSVSRVSMTPNLKNDSRQVLASLTHFALY